MLVSQVRKLSVQERFLYWIRERESIRLKKERGELQPWTDDRILQTYRFCNVRRMDDRVSRWLLHRWYRPRGTPRPIPYRLSLIMCVIARHLNLPESLELCHYPRYNSPDTLPDHFKRMKDVLKSRKEQGHTVFNSAYIIRASGDYPSKLDMVFDETVHQFIHTDLTEQTKSIEDLTTYLMTFKNIGSFMAGQIAADMRWAVWGRWSDRNTWAPIGPGSKRGMNRLFSYPIESPMKQESFVGMLRSLISDLKSSLPDSITSRLEAHDYQNCLCEFDKYERVLHDEGRPKSIYRIDPRPMESEQ